MFSPTGELLESWHVAENVPGLDYWFVVPAYDLAVGADGSVYVAAHGATHRGAIHHFGRDGEYRGRTTLRHPVVMETPLGAPGAGDKLLAVDSATSWFYPQSIRVYGTSPPTTWRAVVYTSTLMTAWPVAELSPEEIDFDWGDGAPVPEAPRDEFAVVFDRPLTTSGGWHTFEVEAQGGLRLWIGPRLLLDDWQGPSVDGSFTLFLQPGEHSAHLEYADRGGSASLRLSWALSRSVASRLHLPLGWRNR